jgi:protein-tyrosine kinase
MSRHPNLGPQMISDGSSSNVIANPGETSDKIMVRRETRNFRDQMKPPFHLSRIIRLTESVESRGDQTEAGESSPRGSERSGLKLPDVSRHESGKSAREQEHTLSRSRSERFAWLWSRLTGRAVSKEDGPPLIINKSKFTGANEPIQILQTQIERWSAETGKRMLLVASALPNEGKSFIALNLAAACASPQTPVLLIDANLRTPSLHRTLGITSTNGLGPYLNNIGGFTGCLHQTNIPGLTFIPVGSFSGSPIRVFANSRMNDFLNSARALQPSHLILIDSSAALTAAEVQILASQVDASLLITAANRTSRAAVLGAADLLKSAPILGVVLNRFEAPFSRLRTIGRAAN